MLENENEKIVPPDCEVIYRRWVRGKNGRIIYPRKGKVLRLVIRHKDSKK